MLTVFSIAILALMGLILFAPWRLVCRWDGGRVELVLRFLMLSFRIWTRDIFAHPEHGGRRGERSREPSGQTKPPVEAIDRIQALLDNQDVLMHVGSVLLRLARRFRHWWRLEQGTVELKIGLGNPAYTGMTHGMLSAIAGAVTAHGHCIRLHISPDFNVATLWSGGEIVIRIRAWDPVKDLVIALVTLPWRGLWKLRRDFVYQ